MSEARLTPEWRPTEPKWVDPFADESQHGQTVEPICHECFGLRTFEAGASAMVLPASLEGQKEANGALEILAESLNVCPVDDEWRHANCKDDGECAECIQRWAKATWRKEKGLLE